MGRQRTDAGNDLDRAPSTWAELGAFRTNLSLRRQARGRPHRSAEMGKGGKAAWTMAVVISAVIFGLAHFDWGVVGIVQTTFMGLALAISYLVVKRNLWVLVLAHAYIDTLLLVQLYLGPAATAAGVGVAL